MAYLYNEETISQAINTKWAGKTVHFAKETDSTNSWIKRLAKDGAEHELWQLQNISLQDEDVLKEDGKLRRVAPL